MSITPEELEKAGFKSFSSGSTFVTQAFGKFIFDGDTKLYYIVVKNHIWPGSRQENWISECWLYTGDRREGHPYFRVELWYVPSLSYVEDFFAKMYKSMCCVPGVSNS